MTSSPGPTPSPQSAVSRAEVPELTATAWRDAAVVGDLPLDLVDLPLEARVDLGAERDAVAKEIAAAQHLQDFLDFLLADQFHSRSRHDPSHPFLDRARPHGFLVSPTRERGRSLARASVLTNSPKPAGIPGYIFRSRAVCHGSSSQYLGLSSSHRQMPSNPVAFTASTHSFSGMRPPPVQTSRPVLPAVAALAEAVRRVAEIDAEDLLLVHAGDFLRPRAAAPQVIEVENQADVVPRRPRPGVRAADPAGASGVNIGPPGRTGRRAPCRSRPAPSGSSRSACASPATGGRPAPGRGRPGRAGR